MALGETLIALRKSRGLSQEQLAEQLDLTRQTISKWELNQSTPDINYIIQLSEFFEVTTDYLIKGTEAEAATTSQSEEPVSDNTQSVIIKRGGENGYKWCFCLGMISMTVSLIGIIAFVICSALHPWTTMINGRTFVGVLGFVLGSKTLWFFVTLIIICILGVLLSLFGIISNIRMLKRMS